MQEMEERVERGKSLSLSRLGISFSAGDLGIAMYDATPSFEELNMLEIDHCTAH